MITSNKKRVAVLRGGPSPEYEISLDTGKFVLQNIPEEFHPVDIFISKTGLWHEAGFEKTPEKILSKVDGVWNAMHGTYGEDGTVQKILNSFGLLYNGSDVLPSAASMNKSLAKDIFKKHGIKTPQSLTFRNEEEIAQIVEKIFSGLPFPIIIKPAQSGSSLGVSLVNKKNDLTEALAKAFVYSPIILAEEYIGGQEVTCGVVEDFRGSSLYRLLPVEVKLPKWRTFFDFRAKYGDKNLEYIVPANLPDSLRSQVMEVAAEAHRSLGLRHYSRADLVVHPKRGIYCIEVNTLPHLSTKSAFIQSLLAIGSNAKEFIGHILKKIIR